ncbi:helix-turn-helix domain-containing protein [Nonomuraea sp. NPDC048826]|uniref:helix-turn-helix domain-containing protein n=1 Tax=Nonomuraea sp. NPDC048826 TaxID=3364347 RepID=UPI003714C19D
MEAPSLRAERKAGTAGHCALPDLSVAVGSLIGVSRYRLLPSPAQEAALLEHCGHARYVWNLAVEQHAHSQARYRCRSCGYAGNADVNAAGNIAHAAGHVVSAREGPRVAGPEHRGPQRDLLLVG